MAQEFIVEADGGSRGNPGPAGYGAVVIDAVTGETLAETAEYVGVATNNVAEYKGLVAGLKAARELDPDATIRVRMDSKLVVEQMSGRWKIKHPDMKPLAAEAAAVASGAQVTYQWIPREKNKHADRLANEAMDAGKRGEQWSAAASTADLRAASRAAAEPAGPPGDAAAGAARARAALAGATGKASAAARPGADAVTADARAARSVAADGSGASGEPSGTGTATAAPPVGWGAADLGAPATFVLLRHGETPLTPEKRFSGSGGSDPSLSDAGREQAVRVAAALAARGTVQAVVSSPLLRCQETARTVAARLGLDVELEPGLRETDFGAWEGLTFAEARERYPDELTAWLASPNVAPPGGESFAEVTSRVSVARDKLQAAYAGRTVLLVTHVTPIKTLVRLALGAPPESLFRMELSAASLSAVAYYADGNASVRLLNDTGHLR
ncbi:bifunctional RNase H/acid phosphatase [Streptomyces spectabilis]|uniref:Bifunctional RNase H/acid phosphatase n=1 Tax=Streptomyces spectabilis TaxID=68270 RepID=A0A5P2XAP0_STRST|nr:bifunctional RNase H/acid phosphatase [Streptomyces spectabilis]MBB5103052.1 putative phosphoglycerate mutase [Streptomyces spectabilis]MCI3902247.1 bifunctional RNase H/acid phosphatase [Streptomyces spectabilis]QEV59616.1 bifunctional RNase H/acid phosphatase [Streptomyces spectabilis]GGV15058.1 bifunctional RNase H/acid phosphatase [Streptomyces spectabilis]